MALLPAHRLCPAITTDQPLAVALSANRTVEAQRFSSCRTSVTAFTPTEADSSASLTRNGRWFQPHAARAAIDCRRADTVSSAGSTPGFQLLHHLAQIAQATKSGTAMAGIRQKNKVEKGNLEPKLATKVSILNLTCFKPQ